MQTLQLELTILEVKNPTNISDMENYKGISDGLYAVFDGLCYQIIHVWNGAAWGATYLIPSKFIAGAAKQENVSEVILKTIAAMK